MGTCRTDFTPPDMSPIPSEIRRTVTEPTYFDIITTAGKYHYGRQMVEVSLFFSFRLLF